MLYELHEARFTRAGDDRRGAASSAGSQVEAPKEYHFLGEYAFNVVPSHNSLTMAFTIPVEQTIPSAAASARCRVLPLSACITLMGVNGEAFVL